MSNKIRIDSSQTRTPAVLSKKHYRRLASTIDPRDPAWLWWPLFPMEAISVLASPGNIGKGLMCADLVARITRGDYWPMSDERAPIGNVIWAETEDKDDVTVAPRLIAAKANMDRVAIMKVDEFESVTRSQIVRDNIRLIVLSPLVSFADIADTNKETVVREALERLLALVEGTQCALIGIMHPNKKSDQAAIERLLGSVAFANFCRSVVMLKAEDEFTARVVHAKWNWGIKANDMLFTKHNRRPKTSPRGQYIGVDWEKADENIDENKAFERLKSDDTEDHKSASAWLIDYLSSHGETKCADVFFAGEKYSYSKNALKMAKNRNADKIGHRNGGFGRDNMLWYLKRT